MDIGIFRRESGAKQMESDYEDEAGDDGRVCACGKHGKPCSQTSTISKHVNPDFSF